MNDRRRAAETYDRLIDCLKNEWGYRDDDDAVAEARRKRQSLLK